MPAHNCPESVYGIHDVGPNRRCYWCNRKIMKAIELEEPGEIDVNNYVIDPIEDEDDRENFLHWLKKNRFISRRTE